MKTKELKSRGREAARTVCYFLCVALMFLTAPVRAQVSEYPYAESFESGLGVWQQDAADNFDWTRNSGGTGTAGTGPNGANDQTYYMFADGNNGATGGVANLYADFDFTDMNEVYFDFYYHMFGNQMGSLYVDVYNGTWNNVWTEAGQKNASSGSAYNHAHINLSAYTGGPVTIRFRSVRGSGFRSDMAVDSINVSYNCSLNAGTVIAASNALCGGDDEVLLTLSGNDSGTIRWEKSTDNINYTVISGATSSTYLATGLNTDTTYYFRTRVTNGCYSFSSVATVRVIAASASVNSYPQVEDFETGPGIWTNSATDDFDWLQRSGSTPTASTGPSGAFSGSYYYYLEVNNKPFNYAQAVLETELGLPNADSAWLKFNYHMYGNQMGSLSVEINGLEVWSRTGQQDTLDTDPWNEAVIDLTNYTGCNVHVAFIGEAGAGNRGDIALDGIEIDHICGVNAGTANADTYASCGGDIELTLTGQDGGTTIQWQTSNDNLQFTDLPGATSAGATLSGLSAGNFYYLRARVTDGCAAYSNTLPLNVQAGASANNTYPQEESFELGWGTWTQSSADSFDWSRTLNGTGTGSTGPDGAQDLQYYMFMDANNRPSDFSFATVESNFDIPEADSVWFNFYYFMYGQHMGSLTVEVNGMEVWSQSGQQQTSGADAWLPVSLDLTQYHGCNINIAFKAYATNGVRGDIAIDNISMGYTCSIDPGTTAASTKALCTPGTVDVWVKNYEAGATIQWQQSTDNATFTDIPGATNDTITTDTLLTGNTYYFRATVTKGCFSYSDTVAVNVGNTAGAISIFPYSESFEIGLGDWVQSTDDDFDWSRRNNATPTANTGPNGPQDGSYYLYLESNGNIPYDTATITAQYDFTNIAHAQLKFYYHMYGSGIGSLHVDVNGLEIWSISGQQQTSATDPWTLATVDIVGYEGCNVEVSIRANTLYSNYGDIAIDNVVMEKICTINPGDANISDYSFCSPQPVTLSLSGYTPGTNIQWQMSTDNQSFSNISGATSATYLTDTLALGFNYYFRAYVSDDCYRLSDTVSVIGTVSGGNISTFPYSESFESGLGGWTDDIMDDFDWTRKNNGTGTGGTGPDGASDGAYYIYTESNSPNSPLKVSEISQSFDFTNLSGPVMNFDYHMYGYQMGDLEVLVNGLTVWSISGEQQTANADPWITAIVDLSNYAGQCKVIVTFKGTTGVGNRSDMAVDNIQITDDGSFWTGAVSTDWTNAGNWSNGVPDSSANVVIPDVSGASGNNPAISSGVNLEVANVTIEAGATLTIASGRTLKVYGNWTNEGAANIGSGTISFSGTHSQLVAGYTSFYDLTINNSSVGITLQDSIRVRHQITFTQGILYSFAGNEVVIADNATSSGGSAASYVDGPILKEGDDNFTFQVGDGGVWAPIGIANVTGATSIFKAEYNFTAYADLTVNPADPIGIMDSVSSVEYWDLNRENGSSNADVTLYWKSQSRSGISDFNALVVAHYDGLVWENLGVSSISQGSVGSITINGVDDFSPFAPGHSGGGGGGLPVTLVSFTATPVNETVLLEWETQVEVNNDHFVVERSPNGVEFEEIGTLTGAGNSSITHFYSFEDTHPLNGTAYYRLRQVDFDGTEAFSQLETVTMGSEVIENVEITVYPNPSHDVFYIDMSGSIGEQELIVYNEMGQVIEHTTISSGKAKLDLGFQQRGIYLMQVVNTATGQIVSTQKLIRQ